jgi:hypothetical protein
VALNPYQVYENSSTFSNVIGRRYTGGHFVIVPYEIDLRKVF